MPKIHHATAKRADHLGVALNETEDGFVTAEFSDDEHGIIITSPYPDAKAALDEAIRVQDLIAAGEYDPDEVIATSSIVKPKYRQRYKEQGDPDSCGDDMSAELKAHCAIQNDKGKTVIDMSAVKQVAEQNSLSHKITEWYTKGLNNGQIRMNLGNMLRKRLRDGEAVYIGNHTMREDFDDEDE